MTSELNDKPTVTFIIGAARSGTTWLARALGADERVAATYETHLFNAYLGPFLATWQEHMQIIDEQAKRWHTTGRPPDSAIGLPYVFDEKQLVESLRRLVADVSEAVAKAQPSVEAIVEKTPSHSGFVHDIDRLTGGRARFIHIVRNGYDVVESTIRAGSGWASDWAPRDPATAARKWAAGVLGAKKAADFGDRYYEVRYEDLVAAQENELLKLMQFIGLDASLDDAVRALERTDEGLFLGGAARVLFGQPFPEPTGFRRPNQKDRSDRNRVITHATVGSLLNELGYDDPPSVSSLQRRAWLATGSAETTAGRIARLAQRIRSDVEHRR